MSRVEIPLAVTKTSDGSAVSGASVQVNLRSGGPATVYSAETGPTTLSNPLTTTAEGRIEGWVDEGSYNLQVSGGTITSYTQAWDAVRGDGVSRYVAGSVDSTALADGSVTAPKISSALKPSAGASAAIEALRALGVTASTAAAGDHTHSALTADQVAATASVRTLGTGAQQAAPGNDVRFTDQRTPTDASVGWTKTGVGAAGLAQYAFSARRNANSGAYGPGATTAMVGATTELYDIGGAYDATNAEYITPFAGIYHFDVFLVWLNAPASTRYRLYLFDDSGGAGPNLQNVADLAVFRSLSSGTEDYRVTGSVDLSLPIGCHIEPRFELIDSGSAGSVYGTASAAATRWNGHLIGRT
jgi:hypothetical protein